MNAVHTIDELCDRFKQEWRSGSEPRIEAYLQRYSDLGPDLFEQLLYEEVGYRQSHSQPISEQEYLERFPDREAIIKRACSSTASLHADSTQLAPAPPDDAPAQADSAAALDTIEHAAPRAIRIGGRLGDFEILKELGEGGMGVVYQARQLSTGRDVALKVIKPEVLTSTVRSRFRNEIATAGLEHDNVVRVYEAGEADGRPYFAMQFIEGKSLIDLLRDGPLENRRAARYVADIAAALTAAHAKGILHRDLKPHNIMIDKGNDRALLADFGLAKLTEATPDPNDGTRTGAVFGTPPYMSPEQAVDASKVSFASDIYSLGATLYQAVTGRPPFQAATVVETLDLVRNREPLAPRLHNPRIDRDLETICLHCLHKEPGRRYESAQAVADELHRYLDELPIQRRPISPIERAWRWSKRNPVVASLSAAVVATLVSGIVISSAYARESNENHQLARQGWKESITVLLGDESGPERSYSEQTLEDLSNQLTSQADRLRQRSSADSVSEDLALIDFYVGRINEELGKYDAALTSYGKARVRQRNLVQQAPRADRRRALATTLNAIARIHHLQADWPKAQAGYQVAINIRQELAQSDATTLPSSRDSYIEDQRRWANSLMNLGVLFKDRARFQEAAQYQQQAKEIRDRAWKLGGSPRLRRDMGKGDYNLAVLAHAEHQAKKSPQKLEDACESLQQTIRLFGETQIAGNISARYHRALCWRLLGVIQLALGAPASEGANTSYENARVELRALVRDNPTVPKFQTVLAGVYLNESRLFADQQQLERAWKQCGFAFAILDCAEKLFGEKVSYYRDLPAVLYHMSRLLMTLPDKKGALENLNRAKALCERMRENDQENAMLQEFLELIQKDIDSLSPPAP